MTTPVTLMSDTWSSLSDALSGIPDLPGAACWSDCRPNHTVVADGIGSVNVTRWQVEWAVAGLRQALELSRLLGIRVRRDMKDVLEQLDTMLMFADEREPRSGAGELELLDLMGSKTVAAELGCTPQHVGRIARDIGGQLVEGRWVFRRQDVEDYKAWKEMERDCS
jgi:hypothetical protein